MEQRHSGFVIGCDQSPGGQSVWKVRVNDANSPFNCSKLVVASIHDGLELAKGLNVHFAVGTVDDRSGQQVLRAVDVRLTMPDTDANRNPVVNKVNRSEGESNGTK